jgi:hypothetical protein
MENGVLKVWHKVRQVEMWIKDFAFDESIHEKRGEIVSRETMMEELGKEKLKNSLETEQKPVDSDDEQPENQENFEYDKLKMTEVRALAKEKGIKFLPTDKKADILAKIKDTNVSNP